MELDVDVLTPAETDECRSELLEEITLNINPSKMWRFKQALINHRCYVLLIGLLLLISLALLGSICAIIIITTTDSACSIKSQPGPSAHQKDFIDVTREYQVKLDMAQWKDRMVETTKFLDKMAEVSSLVVDTSDFTEYIHDEYQVDAKHCHNNDYFRIRHYFYPENLSYNTTLGIKKNSKTSFSKAYKDPVWPADSLFPSSFQKCEQDMHLCYSKFSRETILNFEDYRMFNTCSDLVPLFPWAISVYNVDLLKETPQKEKTVYWWLFKNTGYLNSNTKYEIEITLQYDTLEEAVNPSKKSKPNEGEWSIRIFAMDDGLAPSHQYDNAGVTEAETIWNAMLELSVSANQC